MSEREPLPVPAIKSCMNAAMAFSNIVSLREGGLSLEQKSFFLYCAATKKPKGLCSALRQLWSSRARCERSSFRQELPSRIISHLVLEIWSIWKIRRQLAIRLSDILPEHRHNSSHSRKHFLCITACVFTALLSGKGSKETPACGSLFCPRELHSPFSSW